MSVDPKLVYGEDAGNYALFRPNFPDEFVENALSGFTDRQLQDVFVYDVGAGTGRLGEKFLEKGCNVVFIEPNKGMLDHLRQKYRDNSKCQIIEGTGEDTNIPVGSPSADLIVMGDSAHWIEADKGAAEFKRTLDETGKVAVFSTLWASDNPITFKLEELLKSAYTDFAESGKTIIPNDNHIDKLCGNHLTADDSEREKKTVNLQYSKDDFIRYMQTLSWRNKIAENKNYFISNIIDPLWEYAKSSGKTTEDDKLNFEVDFRMQYGDRALTRSEKLLLSKDSVSQSIKHSL